MIKLQNIQQVHELRKTNSVIFLSNFHQRITSKLKIIETRKITLTAGFLGVDFWNTESLRIQFFMTKLVASCNISLADFWHFFPQLGEMWCFAAQKISKLKK